MDAVDHQVDMWVRAIPVGYHHRLVLGETRISKHAIGDRLHLCRSEAVLVIETPGQVIDRSLHECALTRRCLDEGSGIAGSSVLRFRPAIHATRLASSLAALRVGDHRRLARTQLYEIDHSAHGSRVRGEQREEIILRLVPGYAAAVRVHCRDQRLEAASKARKLDEQTITLFVVPRPRKSTERGFTDETPSGTSAPVSAPRYEREFIGRESNELGEREARRLRHVAKSIEKVGVITPLVVTRLSLSSRC
jgi:hypothetical protein